MLATTLRSSPAAFMNSPSIFSVRVARTPLIPRAASRSSPRSGGRSERTVTSKSSRGRSPASGILRVTRTFSFNSLSGGSWSINSPERGLHPFLLGTFLEELPEDGLQDASVPKILDLDRRVHPGLDLELLYVPAVTSGSYRQLHTRLEFRETFDVVGLFAGEI